MGLFSDISGFFRNERRATAPLFLYNTLSRKKERFESIAKEEVRMYHCGPTVYHYAHIGNLRPYVFADILRRTLEWNGYRVAQVINITDVGHLTSGADEGEDKMEKGARREHKSAAEIAEHYTNAFLADLQKLNIEVKGTQFPRASRYITEQIALIQSIEKKGLTYKTKDGVYFDSAKWKDYGKLGGIDISGLKAGTRVEQGEKRNLTDFALWKLSRPGERREQEWKSPWGLGFPGWHIECSAMSMKLLGKTFDIHTGGVDHIPVHHNNEIAQSESVTGQPLARFWLHNAFLTVGGEKMGKSEDNFITLSTLTERGVSPLALRYFYLGAHYRSPMNFSWDALRGAHHALEGLYRNIGLLATGGTAHDGYLYRFRELVNNDLNTPQAIALVFDILRSSLTLQDKRATVIALDKVLGLNLDHGAALYHLPEKDIPVRVGKLVLERERVRQSGDFKRADELRREIEQNGFSVSDTGKGPKISRV